MFIDDHKVVLRRLFADMDRFTSAEWGVAAEIRANAVMMVVYEEVSSDFAKCDTKFRRLSFLISFIEQRSLYCTGPNLVLLACAPS